MTLPTGDAPAPPRVGPATLVENVEHLWHRADRYVRSKLVWNNIYRATSYLRSALWIAPFLAILLVLGVVPILRWIDARLAWRLFGLTVAGAQSLFQSVITLTLSFLV